MANLNQSLKEAVCIEEEVFFGPITDKERKIRGHFENVYRSENKTAETSKVVENDISKNDSLYKSFSVDDSKYDSFDDSLNEEIDKMPQETRHVTLRKSFDKLKSKRHGFYDSLEDVCSLISNIDKCSISCEVENDSNFNNKQHIIEDSLKNPSIAVANKSHVVNEQVHFDDDSLAIIEYENTFDDSLEEVNVLESIEIEEIDDIENVVMENQNVAIKVEQNSVCAPRNLFDTSVQIVCEKKKDSDTADQEESSDDKNLLYDSLSNSDFKDILKDSLEESEKPSENLNLLKQVCDVAAVNVMKPENIFSHQSALDTSVQIIYEKSHNFSHIENVSEKTNSEYNDISKDSLENSKIFYKDSVEEVKVKTASEHNLQSSNINDLLLNQGTTTSEKFLENPSVYTDDNKNAFCSDCNANQDSKILQDSSVITEPTVPVSTIDNASPKKETFSVDSCHLKILNENINIDKDLKFQLHIEVTVGDKKCQIASQDIKLVPTPGLNSKSEIDSVSVIPVESSSTSPVQYTAQCVAAEKILDIAHSSNPEQSTKNKDCNASGESISYEMNADEKLHRKAKIPDTSNVTQRAKSATQLFGYSEMKFKFSENLSDVSLLQALDLHDISTSFLNESVIQSEDSLMPLNLCSRDQYIQNFRTPVFRNESKENVPEQMHHFEKKDYCANSKKISPNKMYSSKTPKILQKCSSFKETTKKTPGTKIPVRKIENFALPIAASNKFLKQVPAAQSAEKIRRCQNSPHTVDGGKKTPGTTPNKTPHFCKVRNTIFSKVPQIVPSKKYMNIQSPVAQYIRNNQGPVKTPGFDPVLRDCMNRPLESPYHSHQTPKGGSLKSTKKKA